MQDVVGVFHGAPGPQVESPNLTNDFTGEHDQILDFGF